VLLAAAWPWVVGQDLRSGERTGVGRLLGAGVAGFGASALVTVGLSQADLLRGPTLAGLPDATVESFVLAGLAAVLVVLLGLPRALRTPKAASAWVGDQRVAASDDVVVVEGNAYFPASSVRPGTLTPTRTTSVCPWKGLARYYTVTVDGQQLADAAWTYPHPLPFARRVKGRIAFWGGVDVRRE
jgi:uncharacterized protein (DUF427 family)